MNIGDISKSRTPAQRKAASLKAIATRRANKAEANAQIHWANGYAAGYCAGSTAALSEVTKPRLGVLQPLVPHKTLMRRVFDWFRT